MKKADNFLATQATIDANLKGIERLEAVRRLKTASKSNASNTDSNQTAQSSTGWMTAHTCVTPTTASRKPWQKTTAKHIAA